MTLRLVNVPWDQALDIVLRAKGLDKRRDGSVIWVAPQANWPSSSRKRKTRIAIENREDLQTDYIQINYHSATQIFKALTEAKGIGGSVVVAVVVVRAARRKTVASCPRAAASWPTSTNTLMISDIPKKIARMRS